MYKRFEPQDVFSGFDAVSDSMSSQFSASVALGGEGAHRGSPRGNGRALPGTISVGSFPTNHVHAHSVVCHSLPVPYPCKRKRSLSPLEFHDLK